MKINILNVITIYDGDIVDLQSFLISEDGDKRTEQILEAVEVYKSQIAEYMTDDEYEAATDEDFDNFVDEEFWYGHENAVVYLYWSDNF